MAEWARLVGRLGRIVPLAKAMRVEVVLKI
jgi:hypothetical protein